MERKKKIRGKRKKKINVSRVICSIYLLSYWGNQEGSESLNNSKIARKIFYNNNTVHVADAQSFPYGIGVFRSMSHIHY